jgi:hypothetical protein
MEALMPTRRGWSNDEVEAVHDLAATYFAKEVVPNQAKHVAQGHPDRAAVGPTSVGRIAW